MATPPVPVPDEGAFAPAGPCGSARHCLRELGGALLGGSLYELSPHGLGLPWRPAPEDEQFVVVLAGAPTLCSPGGDRLLRTGEVAILAGDVGVHQLVNRAGAVARYLLVTAPGAAGARAPARGPGPRAACDAG